MLLVILGAGASYDSCAAHSPSGSTPLPGIKVTSSLTSGVEGRPPLADHLFQPAYTPRGLGFVPQARLALSELQVYDGGSIEEKLQRYQTKAQLLPTYRQQLRAIQFYIYKVIRSCEDHWLKSVTRGGMTNYASLLFAIEGSSPSLKTCFVTFNYDTLLEHALAAVGLDLSTSEDYLGHSHYRVIKLHGSLNWSCPVLTPLGDFASVSVEEMVTRLVAAAKDRELQIGPPLIGTPPFQLDTTLRPLVPALALPVTPKSTFVCPDEHLHGLLEWLPETTKVLIVGWKAAEGTFVKLLADHLQPGVQGLVIAGGANHAEDIVTVLAAAKVPGTWRSSSYGFTDALHRTGEIRSFIGLED